MMASQDISFLTMNNTLVVHAHQFKNAGSTVDWSLERNFATQFKLIRKTPSLWGDPEELNGIVSRNVPLKAISGHWVNLRQMDDWAFDSFPILMIRNPLERARSVYNFERRQGEGGSRGAELAKSLTFKQYIQWSMSDPVHSVVQNHQTRHCSGTIWAKLAEQDLVKATHLLDRIPVIGVVDLYDETMVLLEDSLAQRGIEIDMSYIRQNTTQSDELSVPDKVESVREELGDLFAELEADNRFDLALYERSRSQLLEQCGELDNLDEKLAQFRLRCVQLSQKNQQGLVLQREPSKFSAKYWLNKLGRIQ